MTPEQWQQATEVTGVAKISSEPVSEIHNTSPDSKWVSGFGQEVGEVVESIFAPANPGSLQPPSPLACVVAFVDK